MGDSSWLNDRLSQPDYNNWVKGNLILRELKKGLAPFLDEKAKDLQQYVRRHVPASSVACTVCTGDDLRKGRYVCRSGICTTILQDINTEYIHHPPGLVKLMNTDNKAWCDTSRYWEIAKAYISTPGYASKRSAAETDCVGLLTIIIKCTRIQSFLAVGPAVFEQIKVARNAMMHSEDSIMSSGELDNLFDDCVQVLQDSRYFAADLTAQGALARIREIKDKTLTLIGIDLPSVMFIVNEVKARQEKDSEAIGNLKVWQELADKMLTEHQQEMSQLGTNVSQLDTRVKLQRTEHQQDMSQLGTNVSQLDTRVKLQRTEHQQEMSQLGTNVSQLDTRVKLQHTEHQQEMSQLGTNVSQLDTRVKLQRTEHQQEMSQLDSNVSLIDSNVSQLDATVSQLDKTVSRHHAENQQAISQLDAHISNLEVRKSTESSHMTEVKRRKEEEEDEERQKKQRKAKELSAGFDELKRYLVDKKYKEDILRGEPSQWFKMKDVLQMFVPLQLREDLERWMALSSTERKKGMPSQAKYVKFNEIKSNSMHDIFFKGSDRQFNIVLLGEAGVGKSTFCHQLVDSWCRVQDSEPKNDHESELKFEFLFFIQARFSDKSQTVYKMIKEQLCPLKYHKVLEKLFTKHPESCLVLIDGLDEWQSGTRGYQELPNATQIHGCTILITSRQWRIESLDYDLPSSCRVLEIQGLDSGGIEKIAEAFIREDNPSADCKPLVNQFVDQINSLKLNNFAQIPFLLIILIKSWLNGNRNLENARGFIYSGLIESLLVHSGKKVEYTGTRGDRTNTNALPSCFNEREHCQSYSSLIHELSRLAFNMLFSDEKENSLVFRKQDLDQQIGIKEHLTLCLKLGLLTETKSLSETKECQRVFSFPHKTVQEFFSALYLSGEGYETGYATFCERVTSPVEVFDLENVVLFLSGMNLIHCKTLFDYICNLVFVRQFADEKLYPAGWSMHDKIVNIHKLAQLCTYEARHSLPKESHTDELQFVIPDLVVDKDTPESKVMQFCSLVGPNIKSLVYIHKYQTTVTPYSVVRSIKTMLNIQRLDIGCTAENTEKYIVRICKYLFNLQQLKSFSFCVYGDKAVRLPKHVSTKLFSKLCTLPNIVSLPNLVSVYLKKLDLSDINTCQFTSQLTSLGLESTKSLSPGFVSGWCNQLHTLYMWDVYLYPAAVHQLCQFVMTSSSLKSLTLYRYKDPSIVFDEVLNLSSHTSLHTLELSGIDLKSGMMIHPGRNWRKIHMFSVSMSESMWQEFIDNLPTEPLNHLYVELFDVKSLNTQTIFYIIENFRLTWDYITSDRSHIEFNTNPLSYQLNEKTNTQRYG